MTDETLAPREWFRQLFIENRKTFFKWNDSQKKKGLKGECKKKVTEVAPGLGCLLRDSCEQTEDLIEAVETADEGILFSLVLMLRQILMTFDQE